METNSLFVALGLLLFGSAEDKATPSISNETYITSTNNNCKVFNPYPQENESITWSGDCVNGYANGKGTLQWYENGKKSDVFIGKLKNGKQISYGKCIWSSGNIYEGNWLNGMPHGKGKKTWVENYVYEGDYLNGKRTGKGKMTKANGSVYQGSWLNGKPHGYGKSTLVKNDNLIDYWKRKNQGHWQGDFYIIQGIFNKGKLEIECSSPTECKKKQANQK